MKNSAKFTLFAILLLAGAMIFQAQTFYGKRKTGFYVTNEGGSPIGYYVPRRLDKKKSYPLVIIFARKATDVMKWKELADGEGLIMVALLPKIGNEWNYDWDTDRALNTVKKLSYWYPVDKNQVWTTGYKNGGNFALMMTVNYPELFSAAAAVDSKTAGVEFIAGSKDENRKVAPFNYRSNAGEQSPLFILSFSKSEFVKTDELERTKELLAKYDYDVTYDSVVGESHSPTNKINQKIFRWFRQTASK